jgi:hypothetical protein
MNRIVLLRGRALGRSLVVVIGLTIAMQAEVGSAQAVFFKNCDPDQVWTNFTTVQRVRSNPGVTGVLSLVDTRDLGPCTQVGGTADLNIVAVSLQFSNTDIDRIVQIGYAECGFAGGCGGDPGTGAGEIPKDGKLHFWYTKFDNAGGRVYLADSWYKAPVVGHQYRMKVEAVTAGGENRWAYCIRDVSAGETVYDCNQNPDRTWSVGTFAWWGTENKNAKSQSGNRDTDSELDIRPQYERGGVWYYVDGNGTTNQCFQKAQSLGVPSDPIFFPSYYDCYIVNLFDTDGDGSLNDRDGLWSNTVSF